MRCKKFVLVLSLMENTHVETENTKAIASVRIPVKIWVELAAHIKQCVFQLTLKGGSTGANPVHRQPTKTCVSVTLHFRLWRVTEMQSDVKKINAE